MTIPRNTACHARTRRYRVLRAALAGAALLMAGAAGPAPAFWSGPCFSFGPGGFAVHPPFGNFGGGMSFDARLGMGGGYAPWPGGPGAAHPAFRDGLWAIPPAPARAPRPKPDLPLDAR